MSRSSATMRVNVRTTPFTWGSQASVAKRMRIRLRSASRGLGLRQFARRNVLSDVAGAPDHGPGTQLRPLQNLQPPVEVLDQGGAALDPVAVVDIGDAADLAHLGLVDVAADHPVDAAPARLVGDRQLVVLDELQCVLHLDLQVGRETPVAEAEAP